MLEILNVIILACHIGTGVRATSYAQESQAKCQKQLIECTDMKNAPNEAIAKGKIVECLIKRGK